MLTEGSSPTEIARYVEREILDTRYLGYEIVTYHESVSVPFLLKTFGEFQRHWSRLIGNGYSENQIRIFLFQAAHGISHCLRWVFASSENQMEIPDYQTWNKAVVDFVTWGMDYNLVAQNYVAWSRGLCEIEVDQKRKKIRFIIPKDCDYFFFAQQQAVHQNHGQEVFDQDTYNELETYFVAWFKEINDIPITTPPIAGWLDWKLAKRCPIYKKLYERAAQLIFLELEDYTDLGGYTLEEFRHFYLTLSINFHFICWIEHLMDSKLGEQHPYGSNPLDGPTEKFVNFFADICEINPTSVGNILNDLTFDSSRFHNNLFIQPVVKISGGYMYILPNLITSIDPLRMLVGALNKGAKKGIYDRLINKIEKFHLRKLKDNFAFFTDWSTYLDKRFSSDAKTITPDLILTNQKIRTIVIVDYKHFITPLTASEVDYKLKEIKKGIEQVEGYIRFFKNNPKTLAELNISEDTKILGVLLFHEPIPVPLRTSEGIYVTDKLTLSKLLENKDTPDLVEFLEGLTEYSFDGYSKTDFDFFEYDTRVADWTFTRTVYGTRNLRP